MMVLPLLLLGSMLLYLPWSSHSFHVRFASTTSHRHGRIHQIHHRRRRHDVVTLQQASPPPPSLSRQQQQLRGPPPLFYRELDEDDDDTTMLKVQSRAPIGFDMRQNLQEQKQEQQKVDSSSKKNRNALNIPLIRALLLNQLLILTLATIVAAVFLFVSEGSSAFSHLDEILHWTGTNAAGGASFLDLQLTPLRLLEGVVGAIPLLVWGNWIESSDYRAFANINFSTIVMTLTLFGRRRAPPQEFIPDKFKGRTVLTTSTFDALVQSFALSSLTGFCEETVFRAEIPALFTHLLHFNLPLAIVSQAFLFGLGHAQPGSSRAENSILIGLQFVNGITLGLVYVLSGGDIVPCMVAHALYDFVTFYKTWSDANDQLEYAEKMYLEPLSPDVESEVRRVLAKTNVKLDPMALKVVKRLFYTFDFDKNKTLSKSEVRKGISYMALERAGVPPPQEIVDRAFEQVVDSRDTSIVQERDRNRLSFSDFLRLYTTMYNIRPTAT